MEIAFLVPRPDKPSTRFRVQSYLPFFSEAGFRTSIFSLSQKALNRWKFFYSLRHFDLVLVQKKLFSFAELLFIRQRAKRLVYDFDDAVMFKGGENMDFLNPQRQKRFERTVRMCDWIIAGNKYLKKEANLFSKRVSVLPTPVDTDKYIPREEHTFSKVLTIGWIGSRSTVAYVEALLPVFYEIKAKFPQVTIKVVSDSFEALNGAAEIERVQWREKEEVKDLQSFDIGIMPLPNNPWTKGKCGFKLLQYQAVGIPVICSPVGVNREMVTEGVNGLFAYTNEEWFERLRRLITSPELRMRMGRTGRKRVLDEYSLKVIWPQFFSTLKRIQSL